MIEKAKEGKQELLDIQEMLMDLNDGTADFSNLTAQLDYVIKKKDKMQGRTWHGIETKRNWEKFDKNTVWKGTREGKENISIKKRIRKDKSYKGAGHSLHIPKQLRLSDRVNLLYSKETNEIGLQFSQNGQYKISRAGTISAVRFVQKFNLPEGEYESHIEDNLVIGKIPNNKEEESENVR